MWICAYISCFRWDASSLITTWPHLILSVCSVSSLSSVLKRAYCLVTRSWRVDQGSNFFYKNFTSSSYFFKSTIQSLLLGSLVPPISETFQGSAVWLVRFLQPFYLWILRFQLDCVSYISSMCFPFLKKKILVFLDSPIDSSLPSFCPWPSRAYVLGEDTDNKQKLKKYNGNKCCKEK